MKLTGARVLDKHFRFVRSDVYVRDGRIAPKGYDEETIDCEGGYLVPGFVDIHTHGCIGYRADSPETTYTGYDRMSRFYASNGVTTFLPAVSTSSREDTAEAVAHIRDFRKAGLSGARIGGIYLEGPYFSYARRGAQDPACLRDPDIDEFNALYTLSAGLIRVISLAPEREGALDFIRRVSPTVRVAVGHTDADYATVKAAFEAGASLVTHTFNAMNALHHREPGPIGAAIERAFDGGEIYCECISDGIHLHGAAVKLLYSAVGDDHMLLISDSIRSAGLPDGEYESGGLPVRVENGIARLLDGTIAGGGSNVHDCVKQAISFGIPPEKALRMASFIPAKAAGIDEECGSIDVGKRADLVLLDRDFNIRKVMIGGRFFSKTIAE